MTNNDWKTLRVPAEAYDKAKEQKEAEGRTWGEQLIAPVEPSTDSDELRESLNTIESRTGKIERMLEEMNRR